jgi:hypothetical protein
MFGQIMFGQIMFGQIRFGQIMFGQIMFGQIRLWSADPVGHQCNAKKASGKPEGIAKQGDVIIVVPIEK